MTKCEICGEQGETNSRYTEKGESGLGEWVCWPCEWEMEEDFGETIGNLTSQEAFGKLTSQLNVRFALK